jgi:hypothetical protein
VRRGDWRDWEIEVDDGGVEVGMWDGVEDGNKEKFGGVFHERWG